MPYLFVVFIFIAQCILFLAHFAAYNLLISAFKVKSYGVILTLKVIFIFLSLSFVLSSFISYGQYNILTQTVYTLAVVWLGFLFYLMLAGIIYLLLSFIFFMSFSYCVNNLLRSCSCCSKLADLLRTSLKAINSSCILST